MAARVCIRRELGYTRSKEMTGNQRQKDNSSYQFIQEKIVSSRRKKWKKLLTAAGTALLLGLVFGLAAGAAFRLSGSWFANPSEEQVGEEEGEQPEKDPVNVGDLDTNPDGDQAGEATDPQDPETGSVQEPEANEPSDIGGESDQEESPTNPEVDNPQTGVDGEEPGEGSESITEIRVIEQRVDATLADYQNIYREIGLLAESVNKSVVKVTSIRNGVDWFQNPYTTQEETSGLVLSSDEEYFYILVSYPHIEQAGEIRISFYQGLTVTGTFLNADTDAGLAVLTVQKKDLPRKLANEIPVAVLGESYSLNVGEPVLALGNPNGYPYSMMFGMITNREAYAYIPDARLSLFHTDMQITEDGEGIIVDLNGKVVGVITHTLGDSPELCTALSISRIQKLLNKLVNQEPRIYAGIIGIDLSAELAEQLQVPGGVYVTEVQSGSPAAEAGIRAGDVILQINEENVLSISAFSNNIQNKVPMETVTLKVCRMVRTEAVEQEFTVTLEQKVR